MTAQLQNLEWILIDVDSTDYVTISAAGALAGVPEETVQQWIADGRLPARAGNRGGVVPLVDVQRLVTFTRTSPDNLAATVENRESSTTVIAVQGAATIAARAIEQSAALQHLRAIDGDRVVFMATLDELHRILVAIKNREIAEQRQRLERAEQAQAVAGSAEATSDPAEARRQSDADARGNTPVHALIAKLDKFYAELVASRDNHSAAQDTLVAKLDHLYAEQIASRDNQIAAQDELIAELRQRAEYTEQQAAMVGEHDVRPESRAVALRPQQMPLQRPVDTPTTVSVRQPAAREGLARHGHPSRALRQRPWVLVGPVVAIILVGIVLSHVFTREAPTGTRGRALEPAFMRFSPLAGLPLPVSAVLAQNVGLVGPRKAVPLPSGQIAVADTGNRRLVLLDPAGHLVASVRAGRLQQPVAVLAAAGALYVLDAARGAIERYDMAGRYRGEIIHAPALLGGRGMALGQGGLLYVANPRSNGIVVLSTQGKILYGLSSPPGPGKEQLDAPADVAVGPGGNLYVADSANNRIQVLSPSGMFVAQWPAPPSTPQQPVQLVPLPDGRVLAADPTGALLVYPLDSALPVFRHPLQVPAGQPHAAGPSGLAMGAGETMLVTDGRSNRLLVVRLPR